MRDEELASQPGLGRAEPVDEDRLRPRVPIEALDVGPGRQIAFEPHDAEIRELRVAAEDRPGDDRHAMEHRRPLGHEPGTETVQTGMAKVERQDRRAVEDRREQARDDAAEGRRVDERQAVVGPDREASVYRPTLCSTLRCESSTPLGRPVDPDV